MKEQISPEKQIEDSKAIIKVILDLPDVHNKMKKDVLRIMLWNYTGAFGKYHTKYISEGAKTSHDDSFRHEHVYTLKSLIQRILNKEDLETVLKDANGCIVTKEEHDILHDEGKDEEGWNRYIKTGIKVWEIHDEILYRRLPGMKKADFMTLPFEEREKFLLTRPLIPFN